MPLNIRYVFLSLLVLFGVFYSILSPLSLQALDYSELITAVKNNYVIHPPGYPLYFWLYKTHIPTWLISLMALALLFYKNESWLATGIILCLATFPIYWEYSMVLDVFILHILLVVLVSFFYFQKSFKWMAFTLGLAAAHHLTIIFLYPLLLYGILKERKSIVYFIAGISLASLLYLSLLLLNTDHLYSWGHLNSLSNLLHHFLRSDYGTFKLSAGSEQFNLLVILKTFLLDMIKYLFIIFVPILVGFYNHRKNLKEIKLESLYLFCFLFYVLVFFSLSNIYPEGMGLKIIQRFMLMPAVMLVILSLHFIKNLTITKQAKILMLCLCGIITISNIFSGMPDLDYSKKLRLEEWARHKVKFAKELAQINHKKVILLEHRDSFYFPLVAMVTRMKTSDVMVISHRLLFNSWYLDKAKKKGIELEDQKFLDRNINIQRDLITPNAENFIFLTELDLSYPELSNLTPFGKVISSNLEMAPFNLPSKIADIKEPHDIRTLKWLCLFHVAEGAKLYQSGKNSKAIDLFKTALSYNPYCFQAKLNLCTLKVFQCPPQTQIERDKAYFKEQY